MASNNYYTSLAKLRLVLLFLLFLAMYLPSVAFNAEVADSSSASGSEGLSVSPTENQGTGDTTADLKRAGRRSWMRAGVSNYKGGLALMEANKSQPGVVTLKSGLQYKILKAGNGITPSKSDTVEVYFQGTLIDGTVFATAPSNLNPAVFKMADVIPGWRQALLLMPVGSRWQLYVPPPLGYGTKGLPPSIGPDATLIYDLELVNVRPVAPITGQGMQPPAQPHPNTSIPQ